MADQAAIRAPSAIPVDDAVLPFEVSALDVRGRLTRLGPALDEILTRHDYPAPVAKLLGEAIVLTTLLGSSLKFEGRFILQTQTDGPVSLMVVDFPAPGSAARLCPFRRRRGSKPSRPTPAALLGRGHLAMTVDQGPDMSRYQGLVALEGGNLEDAAHEYFLRSEQIPTRVRLAVGEEFARRRRAEASLARRRHADAISAQGAGARAAGRPGSRRCAGGQRRRIRWPRTMPGPKAVAVRRPSRTSN